MDLKEKIIEYINDNLGEHLTLEGLCEHFHTNRTTLSRLVKEATGMTPIKYILVERLRRSRDELKRSDMSVSEIAEKYGFADDNYFIRAFKKEHGISPLQFRKTKTTRHPNIAPVSLMTVEQFEHYIRKGFGRVVSLLKENENEIFRSAVVNNAIHDPRYDRQCNGSRGHYLKELIDCFEDSEALYDEILSAYQTEFHPDAEYHISNLRDWALEGSEKAKQTLCYLYEEYYSAIFRSSPRIKGAVDPIKDAYRYAAQSLYRVDSAILDKLIFDGVELMSSGTGYDTKDFEIFFDDLPELTYTTFLERFEELSKENRKLKSFVARYRDAHEETAKNIEHQKRMLAPEKEPESWKDLIDNCVRTSNVYNQTGKEQQVWLRVTEEDKAEIARLAEEEKDIKRRIALLRQLHRFGQLVLEDYPRDPAPLIKELKESTRIDYLSYGDNSKLTLNLGRVVARIRHPAVKEWASEYIPYMKINQGEPAYDNAFYAYLTNYTLDDKDDLLEFVRSIGYDELIHSIGCDVVDAVQFERVQDLPDELLFYLYEHTPCSNCRGNIADILVEKYNYHHTPPVEYISMVKELCHDSDENNRTIGANASKVLDLVLAHNYCGLHRDKLEKDKICGCFYCQRIFYPDEIENWIDAGNTALCPYCGIDSVIGESSGYPITEDFLARMNQFWFATSHDDFKFFVSRVLRHILNEDKEISDILHAQMSSAEITEIKHTQNGFFVDYKIYNRKYRTSGEKRKFNLGKLNMDIEGIEHGMGFVLFIRDGLVTCLEGYTYGETLPEKWWEGLCRVKITDDNVIGDNIDAKSYELLSQKAAKTVIACENRTNYTDANAILTSKGNIYTLLTPDIVHDTPDPALFERMREADDTHIIRMLTLCNIGGLELGAFKTLKAVLDLDPRNANTQILLTGGQGFIAKTIVQCMPPKKD